MSMWTIWLIAAGILLVIELLSGTIAFLCFSIGCLASLLAALAGVPVVWQVVVFAIATVLCFIYLRPTLLKTNRSRHDDTRTNMDALIGRTGKVVHEVTHNADDKGRVKIDGDSWLAYTESHSAPLPMGTQVVVESYDSIVLKVRPKT